MTPDEIDKAWGDADFGPKGNTPAGRVEIITEALRVMVLGYALGPTMEKICIDLGLLAKAQWQDGLYLTDRGADLLITPYLPKPRRETPSPPKRRPGRMKDFGRLLPCPNPLCNSDRVSVSDTSWDWGWLVECPDCWMTGPVEKTKKWATRKWNALPRSFGCRFRIFLTGLMAIGSQTRRPPHR